MRAPEFWKNRGPLALLLSPLGMLYGLSVARKASAANPYKCAVPVICVGNLTAGGSGKTPVAMAVATTIAGRGEKFFFLTRGYGGNADGAAAGQRPGRGRLVGDEALLLAQHRADGGGKGPRGGRGVCGSARRHRHCDG